MKNILFTFLTILSVQLSFSQSSKIKTVDVKTEIVCDHCAECESCDLNIYTKIKDNTKGVRKVVIDADKNIISVKYNSKRTSIEEIEKAIAKAGFKANDLEPTEGAYNDLDGCCKK